ncbi:hypothetical protein SAMN05443575_2222 [Jatrophihabitans endophyticus]|uniref:Uncharacterized protein n=1 Tax=Jatrophihabitans endophyticus TaxID=1206085 RepID=A0A1M5KPN2_9ACTN|nr:hypothetical protein [Jatrophihabitans endophyticus]SHG54718.1 hypothetical protein SAMN05443575_2222 [Jatrophihabitans endophyticus]
MIITLSSPPISLVGDVDPTIQELVNLIPDFSAGQRLHGLYVNHVMAQLPGNYSQMFGTGPSFRSVFYPGWQQDPLTGLLGDTGLDDGWWSGFAIAVLCQAIADMGSDIRGQMLGDKINGDIQGMNATLRSRSARVYANVLGASFTPLTELLTRLPDRAAAKQQYHDALLDNVLNHQLWYQAGAWTNPDWELFNAYAKYIVLGASDAEVDALIGELAADGLPIPPIVDQSGWRTYANELRDKPDVDLNDVRDACAGPVTAATYVSQSRIPNGNCYEFTANSQPGSSYRQLPGGGCCFAADTQVLDGTGQPVPMSGLRPGDLVLTRDATAAVGYVATPLRGERPLYRPAGGGAAFTATHPVVNAAAELHGQPQPAVLAVEPTALLDALPLFAAGGVGPLGAGSRLWHRRPGSGVPVDAVTVTGVEPVRPIPADEHLLDLHLAPSDGSRQEFWVGDGTTFHLACPEFPVLDSAGASAYSVVALMEALVASNGPDGAGWPADTVQVIQDLGVGIFGNALEHALATTPSFDAPPATGTVVERVARLYSQLEDSSPATSALVASLFDGLLSATGQWLPSLVSTGWRTSTLLGGGVLALTVFDLALLPGSLIRHDDDLRLDLTVVGRRSSESVSLWPQPGPDDTAFHRRIDRVTHIDLGADEPTSISLRIVRNGETLPRVFADAPLGSGEHRLRSALLRDASGNTVGEVRFDARCLGREAAAAELGSSGLWTGAAASSYAQALGTAMVAPVLAGIRTACANRPIVAVAG